MKCPVCENQTLKEDYGAMIKNGEDQEGDDLYCPSCGFTMSRASLADECGVCQEMRKAIIRGLREMDYQQEFQYDETEEINEMLKVLGFKSFQHLITGEI